MIEYNDILDNPYVYIGDDEKYHVKPDAPESVKEKFDAFFSEPEPDEDGLVIVT